MTSTSSRIIVGLAAAVTLFLSACSDSPTPTGVTLTADGPLYTQTLSEEYVYWAGNTLEFQYDGNFWRVERDQQDATMASL